MATIGDYADVTLRFELPYGPIRQVVTCYRMLVTSGLVASEPVPGEIVSLFRQLTLAWVDGDFGDDFAGYDGNRSLLAMRDTLTHLLANVNMHIARAEAEDYEE